MTAVINFRTKITGVSYPAVQWAAGNLERDIRKVCTETETPGCQILLEEADTAMEKECFRLTVRKGNVVLQAADEMGFIYGIYKISRTFLGVQPFWFWNDQDFSKDSKKESIEIPDHYLFESVPYRIRYRGWFVNDEVLLHTWMADREKDRPWEMVFEVLLRCGGNMVIPGTDVNARKYTGLALRMGLAVTHHHAEPLGAEMFARAYPELPASYDLYPEKFHALWKDALERQRGGKILWNLGFRGQGDRPFWEDDAKYQTDT